MPPPFPVFTITGFYTRPSQSFTVLLRREWRTRSDMLPLDTQPNQTGSLGQDRQEEMPALPAVRSTMITDHRKARELKISAWSVSGEMDILYWQNHEDSQMDPGS